MKTGTLENISPFKKYKDFQKAFEKDLFILILCVYLHECVCTLCITGAYGYQKMASDSLALEMQMAVNNVGARPELRS